MEVDEGYVTLSGTPLGHAVGAHPLAAFALGRSPLTPGGVGQDDVFSPVGVLMQQSGLRLVLPKGARRGPPAPCGSMWH